MTLCCGPSSALRPASVAGLPITNVPAGMGTISNVIFVFGMVSVYLASAGACRAEVTPDNKATAATTAPKVNGNVGRMLRGSFSALPTLDTITMARRREGAKDETRPDLTQPGQDICSG